jgi:hypothetical protein
VSDRSDRLERFGNDEKRIGVLRRTAREVRTYRVQRKILKTALTCLLILALVLFICAALYKDTGSFTVGVNKVDLQKYGLSLSESRDMAYASSHLNAKINERITNIAEEDLPENIDMIDGEHNGDNYIAYTFYLQNAGQLELSYEYELTISNVTKGLDEAVRVRLYIDGEYVNYAKTRSDGSGPEYGTTEFYSIGVVTKGRVDGFVPGEKTKFTVVIWLEGNDYDCVDRVIDGLARFDMNMKVVH